MMEKDNLNSNINFNTTSSENQKYIPETEGRPHSCDLCGEVFETEEEFLEYQAKLNEIENTKTKEAESVLNQTLPDSLSPEAHGRSMGHNRAQFPERARRSATLYSDSNENTRGKEKEISLYRASAKCTDNEFVRKLITQEQGEEEKSKRTGNSQAPHAVAENRTAKTYCAVHQIRTKNEEDENDLSEKVVQKSSVVKCGGSDSSGKRHQCEVCQKSFTWLKSLKRHLHIHTNEKPYQCDQCDKAFPWSSNLTRHKRTHTGEKPFKCELCDKAFTQLINLTTHKRIHTGEKPFKCDQCDKDFARSDQLTLHKRTHTGEKPFRCKFCDKAFSDPSSLRRHKRYHTGEKPYKSY